MGDRAHIVLLETGQAPIYVYSHWHGSDLPNILAGALARGEDRWNDAPYLSRIIASDVFTAAGIGSTTGAGLSTQPCEDTSRDVTVLLTEQRVVTANGRRHTFKAFAAKAKPQS